MRFRLGLIGFTYPGLEFVSCLDNVCPNSDKGQRTINWKLTRDSLSTDIALNTLEPHPDYVGIICTKSVSIWVNVT